MTLGLVHISDLHFGREPFPPGCRPPGAVAAPPYFNIQGMYPHDPNVLLDLEARIQRILYDHRPDGPRPWEMAILVVSGDLTATGDDSEFAIALTVLNSELAVDASRSVGLGSGFKEVLLVPGNHDHWMARTLYAWAFRNWAASPIHGKYFIADPQDPRAYWWYRPFAASDLYLQLAGVDSSAGPSTTLAARGKLPPGWESPLSSSFQHDADPRLPCVRLLMTHHSLNPGPGLSGRAHAFEAQDERDLLAFASNTGLHGILTGHDHTPHVDISDIEMRCGTSLQSAKPGNSPTAFGWSFLVHELSPINAKKVELATDIYYRTPTSGGFVQGSSRVTRVLHCS